MLRGGKRHWSLIEAPADRSAHGTQAAGNPHLADAANCSILSPKEKGCMQVGSPLDPGQLDPFYEIPLTDEEDDDQWQGGQCRGSHQQAPVGVALRPE